MVLAKSLVILEVDMKVFLNVLGIVCLPVGAVWFLQGIKILNFGVMAGNRRWILIGGIIIVIGIIILILNNRKNQKRQIK
jgi:hypothetical protein